MMRVFILVFLAFFIGCATDGPKIKSQSSLKPHKIQVSTITKTQATNSFLVKTNILVKSSSGEPVEIPVFIKKLEKSDAPKITKSQSAPPKENIAIIVEDDTSTLKGPIFIQPEQPKKDFTKQKPKDYTCLALYYIIVGILGTLGGGYFIWLKKKKQVKQTKDII